MYYDIYNACTDQWIAWGYGTIPNSALKAGNKSTGLVITPSTSASFQTDGDTGPIRITLSADGVYASSFSGHTRAEFEGHVYRSHGSWTERSASIKGVILGFEVGEMHAVFGEGRDKYMEIDCGPK